VPGTSFEVIQKFREFSSSLVEDGISIYTDGSKRDEDSAVGAAVFSPDLCLTIKHKFPSDTSIFSAEAWVIYQILILMKSAGSRRVAVIFSDSKSVLEALSSFSTKSCANYLIP